MMASLTSTNKTAPDRDTDSKIEPLPGLRAEKGFFI